MLTTTRAEISPFWVVEVRPGLTNRPVRSRKYSLTLTVSTGSLVELTFPSARELDQFLTFARRALATAKRTVTTQKLSSQPYKPPSVQQLTLF